MSNANELHDHAPADVSVFIDIYSTFLENDKEFAVAETEHSEGSEVFYSVCDAGEVRLDVGLFGLQIRDRPGLFLVQGKDFNTSGRRNSKGRMEQVDSITLGGYIEFIILAEELGLASSGQETRTA